MWGYHDVTDPSDSAMEPPVCWITNAFDRSPAELVWVESTHAAWGPLRGALLSLSYGNGKIFVVPHEIVGGQMQGGVCALPIPPFPTGVMRGRFHPVDGQLYTCGLFAWAGDRTQPGGFYRVRATGKPIVRADRLERTAKRPGDHLYRTARPEKRLRPVALRGQDLVAEADRQLRLRPPRRAAGPDHQRRRSPTMAEPCILEIPELRPTWCMEVTYAIQGRKRRARGGRDS